MKNAMQLKAVVKNIAKEKKNIRTACVTELYVGAFLRAGISFRISE